MPEGLARFIARSPRGAAALGLLLFLAIFESSAVRDHHRRLEALAAGQTRVLVTNDTYFLLYGGAVGLALWVLLASIPIEDKTGRPPDWWYLGVIACVIAGATQRDQLKTLLITLFA